MNLTPIIHSFIPLLGLVPGALAAFKTRSAKGSTDVTFFATYEQQMDLIAFVITFYLFFAFIFAINVLNSFMVKDGFSEMVSLWRDIDQIQELSFPQKVYKKVFNRKTSNLALIVIGILISLPWIMLFGSIKFYNSICVYFDRKTFAIGVGVVFHDNDENLKSEDSIQILHDNTQNVDFSDDNAVSAPDQGIQQAISKVRRTDIERFRPSADTNFARGFDFINETSSFNKWVKYRDLKKIDTHIYISEETCCNICLVDYFSDSELLLLPCGHHYHFGCLMELGIFSSASSNRIIGTEHVIHQAYGGNLKCPHCQLNLLRHFLYFKEKGLNYKRVKYYNNE